MNTQKRKLPGIGMRTIKTALCVFICLLISYLLSGELTLYSSIAAIVCIQSTIENTLRIGFFRLIGTAVGGALGMLVMSLVSNTEEYMLYLLLLPLGIIVIIYICNLIKMQGSVVICAIVYISVLSSNLAVNEAQDPYMQAIIRIIDTAIGIVVTMLVNRFIAPPKLFDSREMHLVCDNYNEIYERIKDRLTGKEELILYDSSLTLDGKTYNTSPIRLRDDLNLIVRVPVPVELQDRINIHAVYVTSNYNILPIYLPQNCGYVDIPSLAFPCTVVWVDSVEKKGLISNILK